jgi:hypothetical protein
MMKQGISKQRANAFFDKTFKERYTKEGVLKKGKKPPGSYYRKPVLNVTNAQGKRYLRRGKGLGGGNGEISNKGMYDMLYEDDNISNEKKQQDYVSSGTVIDAFEQVAQVPNTQIDVPLDIASLTAVAAVWPLFMMHNGIAANETLNVPGVGDIGKLYFLAATIAYDLWVATGSGFSIFQKYPKAYADLRNALIATEYRGYKYAFISPSQMFGVGGLYPNGYPLNVDTVSLSWIANTTGPLYPLFSTIPNLTENLIVQFGTDNAIELWTRIITASNSKHEWVNSGEMNPYMDRPEAFALTSVFNEDSLNNRVCTYNLEVKTKPGCRWLCYLGLGDPNPTEPRSGVFTLTNYQSAINYAYRVQKGICGILQEDIIIRYKTVSFESILEAVSTSILTADLEYNNVAGQGAIDQAALSRSQCFVISAGQVLIATLILVIERFGIYNWLTFDNSVSNAYVLAGAQYITGISDLTGRLPSWIVESFSGLQLLDNRVSRVLRFVTVPSVVMFGQVVPEGYDYADPNQLLGLMNALYPNLGTVAYHWQSPPEDNLPNNLDPSIMTTSYTEGDQVPAAMDIMNQILGNLQGNMLMNVVSNSIHTNSTFMHFTYMLGAPNQQDKKLYYGDKEDRVVTTAVSDGQGELQIVKAAGKSIVYNSIINELRCRYPFNAQDITWILTRILPVTFIRPSDYVSLYGEKISSPTQIGANKSYEGLLIKNSSTQAHPIAGAGDELTLGDKSRVFMGLGGGFSGGGIFSTIGSIIDGAIGL